MQIQDGSGKGYWAKVDSYNRTHTYSTTLKEISDVSSRTENSYSVTTELFTFNSTNEHPWLYIKNTNPSLYMFISSIIYSYNGGDTNHNRVMTKRVYRDIPTPTDRYNNCCKSNLNIGSNNTALLTAYSWNGSGDGMEIDLTNSTYVSTSLITKGSLPLGDLEGVVLPYNSSLLFTYEPEEIGTASISTKLYFNHLRT